MVKLQHQCHWCGRYIDDELHFQLPEKVSSPVKHRSEKNILMAPFCCLACLSTLSLELRTSVTPIPATQFDEHDWNESMITRSFENRQTFLSVCQGNHYEFDQVSIRFFFDIRRSFAAPPTAP